jgi:glucokinase
VPLPNGATDVHNWLREKIPQLFGREAEFGGKVEAIGAGFGGVLESRTGRIRISVQVPGWQDFPLKDWLEQTFHVPAIVANDTVAGGYAELCRGSGVPARHFFYSNIGSGIGGALFLDRVPYDGLGMGGAYLGHTYVPDWSSAELGRENKLENICSGWSIERRLRTPGYVARESALMTLCAGQVSALTCAMLGEAARRGDAFATAEIDRIARSYAIALSNLLTLVSPDVVAIGGGVANLGEILLDPIRRHTDERVFVSVQGAYRIVPCVFMDAAVPVGAALLARDR